MAHSRSRAGQRDNSTPTPIANDPLLDVLSSPGEPSELVDPLSDDPLLAMEDRRFYSPDRYSYAMKWASDVVVSYPRNVVSKALYEGIPGVRLANRAKTYVEAGLAFRDPERVAVCVRRHIRRQVIFALSLHRRIGSGRGKRRRRNLASAIRC